jgi:Tol biopolymer transport system component
MNKIFPAILLALALAACVPQGVQVPQSPLLPFLERKSGLIAYVGLDGNVYVTDQSGSDPDAITDDAALPEGAGEFRFYQYPTWSLDGSQLAFVSANGSAQSQTGASMYVYNVDDATTTEVFSSEAEFPFYLYWSPDHENVTFLSTSANGSTLILQSAAANGDGRVILDTGSPFYWSWAPDGKTMIVHTGNESSTPERLAFLQADSALIEDGLDSTPASFQSPAWSPDGSRILLTRATEENGKELALFNAAGEFEKSIAAFDVKAAFAWSPDSELVAHIEGSEPISAGTLGALHVTELAASEDFFQDSDVFAFFWSPDSRKLAYFKPILVASEDSPNEPRLVLELYMLDTVTGESRKLFTFEPTSQFSGILPYFDQYHQSATIWSPDSNNLVLSFVDQEGNSGIAVVAASGQLEPRIIAQGFIAFWSWR